MIEIELGRKGNALKKNLVLTGMGDPIACLLIRVIGLDRFEQFWSLTKAEEILE